jgi:hypothetical protein
MKNVKLDDFIGANRDELIRRCRAKVATRSASRQTHAESDHGVPLFLDQLVQEIRVGASKTDEIGQGATQHGHHLFLQGLSISEVVHAYGDICQSITDLAVELNAPISADDFRTLNRCLDDAIAGAVTEYAREQDVPRQGESYQLWNLADTAITAFEALQTGRVGVGGSTGTMVRRNLMTIRAALACQTSAAVAPNVNHVAPNVNLEEHAIRR